MKDQDCTQKNDCPVSVYIDAFRAKDFKKLRGVLADDMTFKGPMQTHASADSFVESLAPLAPMLKDYRVKNVMVDPSDSGRVCVTTEFETAHPGIGTTEIAEVFTVRDGKISSLRIYFDPRPYAALM